ncbi:Retrovirus-related Pol polyprotein from transposon TNT 1-94 [Podosphaera aphanis]|nr:Retrovirus-related Pol polyprotein from transposon TNT 1-94 [Podosphaera aphanis]
MANVYSHQRVPHIQITASKIEKSDHLALNNSHILRDASATADTWHARFGHITEEKLKQALQVTNGIKIMGNHKLKNCHACKEAMSKRIISRVTPPRPNEPLTHWNVDVVTVSPESIGKAKYFTLMTDAASLYHRVGFHSSKDGAYVHLQNLVHYIKTNTGVYIKVLHIDGGREYGGTKLTDLRQNNGIDLKITTPHNSEQNGRAESSNHFVCTVARKMMIHGKIPKGLWTEAIQAAVYIINIMPSTTLQGISPYQTVAEHLNWNSKVPYVGNLRVYGCKVFVLDQDIKRSDKFASRAQIGKLVGYEAHNIYRVWIPKLHKVIRSTNVSFDEECLDLSNNNDENIEIKIFTTENEVISRQKNTAENKLIETPEDLIPEDLSVDASGGDTNESGEAQTDNIVETDNLHDLDHDYETNLPSLSTAGTPQIDDPPELRRSSRIKTQSRTGIEHTEYRNRSSKKVLFTYEDTSPKFAQPKALLHRAFAAFTNSLDAAELQAMREEIQSLQENNVWQLVHLKTTNGKTIIKGRWVFKLKLGADGTPVRFKARWVVKCYTQQKGIDYDETYAAVTKATTLKLLIAMIAHYNLEAKQYDIMTAFLYAKIKEREIYVEQPHGFEESRDHVCLLLRALYGLKQSPMLWFEELTSFLISKGYVPLSQDPCIFQHHIYKLIIAVYVDDLIAAAESSQVITSATESISGRFKMRALGDISFYLGCRIIRIRKERKLYLVQDAYIKQLLGKYHMQDSRKALTPMEVNNKLQLAPEGHQADANLTQEYQSLVGGLMWPAMQTRPDIAFATSQLAKHMNNPTHEHLEAAKRVLRYLNGKPNYGV